MASLRSSLSRITALVFLLRSISSAAVEPEIHVYDDSLESPGSANLTVNNNYVAHGPLFAPFRGAVVPEGSLTGGTELAYGVRPGIEGGIYLPIVSVERSGALRLDGAELRMLLIPPSDAGASPAPLFYGVNVALDINTRALSQRTFSGEVQPIVGGRWHQVTLAINLNLDAGFDGMAKVRFSPSERVAFAASPLWTVGLEHYSDWGPLAHLLARGEAQHTVFVVAQETIGPSTIEAGVGRGFSADSDRTVIKISLSFEL